MKFYAACQKNEKKTYIHTHTHEHTQREKFITHEI